MVPRVRFETRFHDIISAGSRLTLGIEYTEDSVRGSETYGLLQLRIPFGGGKAKRAEYKLAALERRMVETVYRDDDVIVGEGLGDDTAPVLNPNTGQVITYVETINASTANIPGTVSAAGQNSLIIADGSQGGINLTGTRIDTQPGQIITGGGQPVLLQAQKSNGDLISMSYTPSGQRPNISQVGSADIINVSGDDGVVVNGVTLAGGRPIRIDNSSNVIVNDINIISSAVDREGIFVQNNSDAEIMNVAISNTGTEGLQ